MRAVVVSSLVAVTSANVFPSLRQLAEWAHPVDNHTTVKDSDTIMTGRMGITMDLEDGTLASTLNKDAKFVGSLKKALADSLEGLKEADLKISDIIVDKTRTRRLTERALTMTGAIVDFNYSMLIAEAKVAESVYKLTETETFEATLKTKLVAAIEAKMDAAEAAKFAVTKVQAFAAPTVTGKFDPSWAYPEVVHEAALATDTVVTGRMGMTMNLPVATTATSLNKNEKFVASLKAALADSLEGVLKKDVKISDITIDKKRTRRLSSRQLEIAGAVVDFKYSMLIAEKSVAESVYKLTEAESFQETLKANAIKAITADMGEEAKNFQVTAVEAFAAPVATGAFKKAPASGANSIGVAAALSASLVAAMLI